MTPVGVESPAGDSTGRRVSALPSGADPRTEQGAPSQEPAQIGKVKLFPADSGHHVPAPEWEGCRVSSSRSAFCSVPVGRCGWRVLVSCLSWLLPGSFRFLRECFSLASDTDKGADL